MEVAPDLLGALLTHRTAEGTVTVRMTEVEAYAAEADPGSHAFRGERRRNRTMFGAAGHLYAYFTYGMHVCANITCLPAGAASAVLVRAGEVVAGVDLATERRGGAPFRDLARGPARLAVALGIALTDDGADLLGDGTFALEQPSAPPTEVRTGPRVGVSGPGGDGAAFPWRFWLADEATVSPYRAAVRRRR